MLSSVMPGMVKSLILNFGRHDLGRRNEKQAVSLYTIRARKCSGISDWKEIAVAAEYPKYTSCDEPPNMNV